MKNFMLMVKIVWKNFSHIERKRQRNDKFQQKEMKALSVGELESYLNSKVCCIYNTRFNDYVQKPLKVRDLYYFTDFFDKVTSHTSMELQTFLHIHERNVAI